MKYILIIGLLFILGCSHTKVLESNSTVKKDSVININTHETTHTEIITTPPDTLSIVIPHVIDNDSVIVGVGLDTNGVVKVTYNKTKSNFDVKVYRQGKKITKVTTDKQSQIDTHSQAQVVTKQKIKEKTASPNYTIVILFIICILGSVIYVFIIKKY